MTKFYKILLTNTLLIFIAFNSFCIHQEKNGIPIDEKKYAEHVKEYKYPREKEKIEKKEKSNTKVEKSSSTENLFTQNNLFIFFWTVVIILVVAALGYLIWYLSKNNTQFISSEESEEMLKNVEENLLEANIEDLITKAINAKNYELAIKLTYFKVLKNLTLRELIKFRKDKSNKEYLYELFDHPAFKNYKILNIEFDKLRYSKVVLNETVFQDFNQHCTQFIAQL